MKNQATKPAAPKTGEKKSSGGNWFAVLTIVLIFIIAVCIYNFILGDGSHFEGGDNKNEPIPGDYLGTVYKGGFIVPVLMTMLLSVIVFSIERAFTLGKATGTGSIDVFVRKVKSSLASDNINEALAECDKQKGSVGNVINSVLHKYKEMAVDTTMSKDQKVLAIQKELEDSTALELPMLEKNLTIIATLASVATLTGLLGTVMGMIRAFAGMAQAGAPDSSALSTGISEALINTALGIGTSALAIIAYNFFTSKIDTLTYSIDEAGFSIMQNFASKHN
ncbi:MULTISPECIES: MotA/TolQ/ExbB proton channel family protein [Xanthocytophaga]|uniref:MotA/TolQ/ExbB proton channel family protein n=2 Tax=Xanthocytophaga TaxID=3078918 RepID=A0AAE3QQ00_9BACT|nr:MULTISPECIES: MotA/TolQ/ExbB proton channel family protein [Xanthocytophaga]MDJ1470058.1 MotA/TolQ/ExbB proton channel family protein [Xanthocytophaga flavus]MDJ1481400.1 MotA/TolQ/ExbB proton channel family protein [Xanthocytophaga flavus]MDJ1502348.1 MotA/TolQ/ExbB proton channel family protein [Xanthocytophaga agilis]